MNRLVYITSPSYSGSTLLTLLMGAHPDIGTIGEFKMRAMGDVEKYECSCGELIRRCAFWQQVQAGMGERGEPFDIARPEVDFGMPDKGFSDRVMRAGVRGPLFEFAREAYFRGRPACQERIDHVLRRNEILVDVLAEIFGCDVIVDGSKDPIRLAYLRQSDAFDLRVIHLVRDGRGVSNSFRRHENLSIDEGGAEFVRGHRQADRVAAQLPRNRMMTLIYEDLCVAPAERMKDVYEFVGVDPDRAPTDFSEYRHHLLGNSMRLLKLSEIRVDSKWKRELSEEDLNAFERVAGEVNRNYGYA